MNRALLVGINAYPKSPLRGCVNDIADLADFLVKNCNFSMDEIRLLVDSRATKINILDRLKWLITGLKKGDRVLFHYSGHGAQLPTRNPQGEVDGLDEIICPYDFDWTDDHVIRDKEFNALFSRIPDGVEFIWISDSCHSGDLMRDLDPHDSIPKTILPPVDIDWRLRTAKQKKVKATGFSDISKELNLALISGCQSDQTSADAIFENKYYGAFTFYLLKELKKEGGLSLPLTKLITNVGAALKKNDFEQQPQLEGNSAILKKPFLK